MSRSTHLDESGAARMVDVSGKPITRRVARASGRIRMGDEALAALTAGDLPKGDAFSVARLAGILAAKRTPELVPLCHPLPLDRVAVEIEPDGPPGGVVVRAEVVTTGRTGAEMEALTAVSAALLSIYDMAKSLDRGMTIEAVRLEHKSGGASGSWDRSAEDPDA